jgi:hypothetical protein
MHCAEVCIQDWVSHPTHALELTCARMAMHAADNVAKFLLLFQWIFLAGQGDQGFAGTELESQEEV